MGELFAVPGAALTMSSREIAELCDKRHDSVMRDIRNMLADLYGDDGVALKFEGYSGDGDRGSLKFEGTSEDGGGVAHKFVGYYIADNGKKNPCFNLPKRETLILVSGYSVALRARIIDRWQELERQAAQPVDPMQVLNDPVAMRGLLLTYTEKVLQLQAENAELQPKAAALDRIATADGSLNITAAAKALQVRPKDLFTYLRQHGWIYRRPGAASDLGYQSKVMAGLLEHKITTVLTADGHERIFEQVLVTAKGLARLSALFTPATRVA